MKEDGSKIRQAEYWDTLVFSKAISKECGKEPAG
jgi:hypothetical protein